MYRSTQPCHQFEFYIEKRAKTSSRLKDGYKGHENDYLVVKKYKILKF